MEVGDKIAALFASPTPVVVRPEGVHYICIGNCFVEGLMKDEAVHRLEGDDLRVIMFPIHQTASWRGRTRTYSEEEKN